MTRALAERELVAWLVGDSAALADLRRTICRIAPLSVPVWVEGETGVGKEQVAQALHAASGRVGPFVSVNVCAIAEPMFEAAFFGHVRGAFTGATSDSPGYFAEADNGTLFLDEVSGLSLSSQAKLLRAVETLRFRPVGARKDRESRFRIVAASNEPFGALQRSGRFRSDLGFRLRGSVMALPPLRERLDDIASLAQHFIDASGVTTLRSITPDAVRLLRCDRWPGNVRELRQLIAVAMTFCRADVIDAEAILEARRLLPSGESAPTRVLDGTLQQERDHLEELLAAHRWDTLRVAELLGVARRTVYRRMLRLGIEVPSGARPLLKRSLTSRGRPIDVHEVSKPTGQVLRVL